jgi:hypothetical protein
MTRDLKPLFSAERLPRADVREPMPEESTHPGSFTARLRRLPLTDGEALFRAESRQREYARAVGAADVPPRN